MIDDRNFAEQTASAGESKKKKFWKAVGIGALSFFLALLTVIVINFSLF